MSEITRNPGESLTEFIARRNAALGRAPEPAPPMQFDEDLLPDVDPPQRSQEQLEMDAVLGAVDIVEAYNRWCGKMHVDPGNRTESIMMRCPNPAHEDKNPSAWATTEKGDGGVGECAQCGGFDKYDIAAYHFGFDVPGYKGKTEFPELRRMMAEDLGYRVVVAGKDEWLEPVVAAQPTPTPTTPDPEPETETEQAIAEITELLDPIGDDEHLQFDWRTFTCIQPETFLHSWLTLTSESYEPEEFYFFEGLVALACAVGNKVTYEDSPPVRPNLMACMIGPTGAGKSIAISYLTQLLHAALPWSDIGGGVRMISSPGSGEALLDQFNFSYEDPATNQKIVVPVNGLYRENELAAFAKKISRSGNTSRELIMDLYDKSEPVSTVSRGSGEVIARDHFMQMITSTQPESIRRLMTDGDAAAGFLNRWVYAFGTSKKRPAIGVKRIDISDAVPHLQKVRGWSSGQRVVDWHDPAAAQMWLDFYDQSVWPLGQTEDNFMVARMDLLAKKLLLLFAINDRSTTIFPEHVETLMQLWPYLLATYGVVDRNVGINDFDACMEAVDAYMTSRPGKALSAREISKQSAARKFGRQTVVHCLELMARAGFIQEVPRAKSDRVPRYVWEPDTGPTGATVHVLPNRNA